MHFSVHAVDQYNFREIAALHVQSDQQNLIESNALSMLEAWWEPELGWRCFGLYVDETPAGFLMAGAWDEQDRSVWLDRFMMDSRFQGRGLGGHLLQASIDTIRLHWPVRTLVLSIHPGNTHARHFYEKHGFTFTGERDTVFDEDIMTLTLQD